MVVGCWAVNAGGCSNRCSQGMGYWIICTADYIVLKAC